MGHTSFFNMRDSEMLRESLNRLHDLKSHLVVIIINSSDRDGQTREKAPHHSSKTVVKYL